MSELQAAIDDLHITDRPAALRLLGDLARSRIKDDPGTADNG